MTEHELAHFNHILTSAELRQTAAIGHLFTILEGEDVEQAKNDARGWLREVCGDEYKTLCRIALASSRAMRQMRNQGKFL